MTKEKLRELKAWKDSAYKSFSNARSIYHDANNDYQIACKDFALQSLPFKKGDIVVSRRGEKYFYFTINSANGDGMVISHLVYRIKKNGEPYANTSTVYGDLTKEKL